MYNCYISMIQLLYVSQIQFFRFYYIVHLILLHIFLIKNKVYLFFWANPLYPHNSSLCIFEWKNLINTVSVTVSEMKIVWSKCICNFIWNSLASVLTNLIYFFFFLTYFRKKFEAVWSVAKLNVATQSLVTSAEIENNSFTLVGIEPPNATYTFFYNWIVFF